MRLYLFYESGCPERTSLLLAPACMTAIETDTVSLLPILPDYQREVPGAPQTPIMSIFPSGHLPPPELPTIAPVAYTLLAE